MTCNSSRGSCEVSKKVLHLTVGPLEVVWWVGGLFDNTVSKVQVLLDFRLLDLTLDFDFRLWTWTWTFA